jgi:dihydrodipicolinate synthase/N-acetylneuraminate lyase
MTIPLAKYRGVFPVLQIPYTTDESIDFVTLGKEIDWLFDSGVNGITLGMVSEILRHTDAERDKLVAAAVEYSKQRGSVIASAGGESTRQAIRHANAAEQCGATALMITPPALTRLKEFEILRYYEAILAVTALRIIVQDSSGYIGNPVPISVQAELFKRHSDRVMFKPEMPPLGLSISRLMEATHGEALIFDGTGGVALIENHARGVCGIMPGSDLPWAFVKLWRALEMKDELLARRIHLPIAAIVSSMASLDSFLAAEKLFLQMQNIFPNQITRGPSSFKCDPVLEREWTRLFHLLEQVCHEGT